MLGHADHTAISVDDHDDRGSLLHSISSSHPVSTEGRGYSFLLDVDFSLTEGESFSEGALPDDTAFSHAYGWLEVPRMRTRSLGSSSAAPFFGASRECVDAMVPVPRGVDVNAIGFR